MSGITCRVAGSCCIGGRTTNADTSPSLENKKSLRQLARVVFKEHTDAEARAVLHIEMVAPSDKMVRLASEHDEIENADVFFYEVAALLREVIDAGKPLPQPFSLCDTYRSSDLDSDNDTVSSNADGHYDCINCSNGFVFGMTKRELFAKYHSRWDEIFNKSERNKRLVKQARPQPTRVASRAAKASDEEPLWFALANFGHHAGGVELHEMDLSDAESYRPRCLSRDVLFFFRLLDTDDLLLEEFAAELKSVRDAERVAEEQSHAKRRKEREAEKSSRVREAIAFFTGG